MSKETAVWLNTQTLIGFTDKRGNAWHYRAELQGDEPNHYVGAVPVADVERRLFAWDAVKCPLNVIVPADMETMTGLSDDGMPIKSMVVPNRSAIVRADTGDVFGVFSDGYQIHQYREWLLRTVSAILGDSLAVGSAGLLKNGAVAWVSVEVPDTIVTPEGVAFRPNLLATTSHDGTLATTFKRVVTNVVCDNTHGIAMGEKGQVFRVKHSAKSLSRINDARDALMLVHDTGEQFAAEVKALCQLEITATQWGKFVEAHSPLLDEKGARKTGRGLTMAQNEQDTLNRLYKRDPRVSPWTGTAWGVVQAVNTYVHHEGIVRGADRAERNMLRAVNGGADKLDSGTLTLLDRVLQSV